jgi:predicted ABC-type ATPase
MNKQLWIIVGGNGAGKSTFYDRFLKQYGLSFLNADMLAKELADKISPEISKKAQQQALDSFHQKIEQGETFCYETVFSHSSKIKLVIKAKKLGYTVNLVFIHLSDVNLNKARIVQRVKGGGHDVPSDKVTSRIPRTLKNIHKVISKVDHARLIDNSSGQDPFKIIATVKNAKIIESIDVLPDWAKEILKGI